MKRTELYHHGVLGMKWGVRRYQNSDGSLTSAGKKRYSREAASNNWEIGQDGIARSTGKKNKGEVHKADPNKWVNEDLDRTKRTIDSANQLNNSLKNADKYSRDKASKNRERLDLSDMTDQELRERINREMLERQYNDVFNPPTVSKGHEYATQILDTAGVVLPIAASAVGLAIGIRQLAKGV